MPLTHVEIREPVALVPGPKWLEEHIVGVVVALSGPQTKGGRAISTVDLMYALRDSRVNRHHGAWFWLTYMAPELEPTITLPTSACRLVRAPQIVFGMAH